MKKFTIVAAVLLLPAVLLNAKESSENEKNFIRGNLSDKIMAVRSSDSSDLITLTKKSIKFVLENKAALGNDRDLNALAVTGVLSISPSVVDSLSETEKKEVADDLMKLCMNFEDTTVKIAVLTRITSLNVPKDNFVTLLNNYIKNANPETENHDLLATSITTIGQIGNQESFKILFNDSQNSGYSKFSSELETSIGQLAGKSENELLEMIRSGSTSDCRNLFNFVMKNSKNPQILKAEIAENTLSRTIYIYENSGNTSDELISLQLDSFSVLKELKWTRASKTAISYFSCAEKEYSAKKLKEQDFISIITGLAVISPMEAVSNLTTYLAATNKKMENSSENVSEPVVLAVINSLGDIGDKNAFDPLLAVTYYSYSDTVIAAARTALAKLKW